MVVSSISALSELYPYHLKDGRKSEESPALAAQLRAFSVISSSLRAELSTSRNHYVGKVSAFADDSLGRSHPLTGCLRYCGRRRLLASPSTSAISVLGEARSSTLPRPCGQRSAARHSLCNMQYGSPCFFAKLIPCFIHWRDSSSGVLF